MFHPFTALVFALLAAPALLAQAVDTTTVQTGSDIPAHWRRSEAGYDYTRREVMIPMRDGVQLHTVLLIPKLASGLPMLLDRTPYDADGYTRSDKPLLRNTVPTFNREWVDDGYILVYQDVRGKYGSQGDYVMTRPPIGPLNPTATDDSTDAWDTIDWLVKHVPESNRRVGMIGSSYEGWSVVMALLNPHPALRVAAPESPMIDGWMGDDWFHHGAFRQMNFDYLTEQTTFVGKGQTLARSNDDYRELLDAGTAGGWARQHGLEQLGFWTRLSAHPAYDAFWQGQALDRIVAARPSKVPTMWIQGLWDQEDMYGAIHAWEALKAKGMSGSNHLVMGPWSHSQVNGKAEGLGPFKWNGDTAGDFRRTVLVPFFNRYLKDAQLAEAIPPVMIYNAAEIRWDKFADWPVAAALTPLYLQSDNALGFGAGAAGEDSYVSDPAKPVPFLPPPVRLDDHARWSTWLLQDQRFVSNRPDVLSYRTAVLTSAVTVQGRPMADLFATTTGSDADFVVKLIDIYPPVVPERPEMGGYELPVSQDILRGRYRDSFTHPSAIPAGATQEYRFDLPTVNYVFKPGHRIMVQIQSTQFPLYDRNPQTYVPNIFFAQPEDFQKATITIQHGSPRGSAVLLPIVPPG